MARSASPSRVAFVLVAPQYSGNVGAAARALKNNGFRGLRIVNGKPLDGEAEKMAWKSLDVLRKAKRFDALDAAVADCKLIAGFSARARRVDRPLLTLDAALPSLVAAARKGRVALLFGREDRGLTREEMTACRFLVRIDASRERAVYNLAQAVLVVAYRLRRAIVEPAEESEPVIAAPSLPAAARAHLRRSLEDALRALGYGEMKDPRLLDRILARSDRLLDRAALDAADLAMLQGVIRRILGTGRKPAVPPSRSR